MENNEIIAEEPVSVSLFTQTSWDYSCNHHFGNI